MANEFKIKKGLIVTGADGGTVVDIQGSQGQLFSVTDDLSGSIFAVSDISGVPILDVNSSGLSTFDGDVVIGSVDSVVTGLNIGEASPTIQLFDTTNDGKLLMYMQDSSAVIGTYSNHALNLASNSTLALTIDTSQNATFAGNVTSGLDITAGSYSRVAQTTVSILSDAQQNSVLKFREDNDNYGFTLGYYGSSNNFVLTRHDNSAAGDTVMSIPRNSSAVTFLGQAFSAATSSGNASSTLTTKGYVDGLITGATIYRGAWDPDVTLNSGYGNPDLSGVTQTSGYYYICSAAGTAEPNGTGTEPDTWETGDWVIYNDVSGTGQWQKIDNSSVLSGVGTGQTVALWEGAGSVTDSDTLGNAPITVSGNDTTFTGNVTASNFYGLAQDLAVTSNDTFNGTYSLLWHNGPDVYSSTWMTVNGSNDTLTVPTIAADLNGTINTATTGATQTAGNNSTLIATTAYVDSAVAAAPQGDITGSGTAGYIPKWSTTSALVNSSALYNGTSGLLNINNTFSGSPTGSSGSPDLWITGSATDSQAVVALMNAKTTSTANQVNGDIEFGTKDDGSAGYVSARIRGIQTSASGTGSAGRGELQFATNVSNTGSSPETRMVIDYTGKVGIGTTNPNEKLDVAGKVYIEGNGQNWNEATPGVTRGSIHFDPGTSTDNTGNAITFGASDVSVGTNAQAGIYTRSDGAYGTKMYFATTDDYSTGSKTSMMIDYNGNVGIGTTSPGAKLEVEGDATSNDTPQLIVASGGADNNAIIHFTDDAGGQVNAIGALEGNMLTFASQNEMIFKVGTSSILGNTDTKMTIDTNGNVGIGTTSPGRKLEVDFTGSVYGAKFTRSDAAGSSLIEFANSAGVKSIIGYDAGVDGYKIGTASATNLVVKQSGNVGIGTITPLAKLDIQGTQGQLFSVTDDLSGDIFSVADISGVPILNVNSSGLVTVDGTSYFNGNVGIGTNTPATSAKLTVMGNQTFGIPGNGSNTDGRFISIEGNADSGGEGSGRIFFTEHNSTTASMDAYGMSIGYRGGATSIVGASGETWTGLSQIGNGEWGMWGHNASNVGSLIMHGDRAATYVDFSGNNIQGIQDAYVADQIIHTGDTNTYMQFHAADQWRVVTGGSERLEVNNSAVTVNACPLIVNEEVGIGTTSPNTKLDVISGTNNGIRISATDTTSNWRDISIRSYVTQAQAAALTDHTHFFTTNPSGQSDPAFQRYGGTVIQCRDDGNSNFAIRIGNGNGHATALNINASGVTTFNNTVTATNFILSSDERKKTKIKDLARDNVNVNWKSFELKEDEGEYRTGVVAQELEEKHPEFVKTDDEGFKSVKYIDLLIAKIAELEARLEKAGI